MTETAASLALALLTVSVIGLLVLSTQLVRTIRSMQRTHDRRVDDLLNRLAHAKGREWVPPPADEEPAVANGRELVLVDPDQEPI